MTKVSEPIETVTVEATHLMDWPRFLLVVALALGLLKVLK